MDRAERRTSREGTLLPNIAAVRVPIIERQGAANWGSALDIVVNRLVTVERTVREQAQFMSSVKDHVDSIFGQTQILTKQANTTEKNLQEACDNIVARYTLKDEHDEKIDTIDHNSGATIARLDSLNEESA